jgi:hypothetical protein
LIWRALQEGISIDWYRGLPLGRLLIAQWDEKPDSGGRPKFKVLAEGGETTFTAVSDSPMFLKINNRPAISHKVTVSLL